MQMVGGTYLECLTVFISEAERIIECWGREMGAHNARHPQARQAHGCCTLCGRCDQGRCPTQQASTLNAAPCTAAVIEKYTRNARFCLICNYVSKIIPALQVCAAA